MLTKDLLRYKVSGAYAKPQFVAVTDNRLMELASRLIASAVPARRSKSS